MYTVHDNDTSITSVLRFSAVTGSQQDTYRCNATSNAGSSYNFTEISLSGKQECNMFLCKCYVVHMLPVCMCYLCVHMCMSHAGECKYVCVCVSCVLAMYLYS